MSIENLLSIFGFFFKVIFDAIEVVYNIQLTENIKFGALLVVVLCFFIMLYVIFRPFRKE